MIAVSGIKMALTRLTPGTLALGADAFKFDLDLINPPQFMDFIRGAQIVKRTTEEIHRSTANDADEVVMGALDIRVEALAAMGPAERVNQTQVHEQPEIAVHGIQRDRRQPFLDALVDRFGVGMVVRRGDFAENLQALLGQFDARLAQNGFEPLQTLVKRL